MSSFVNIRFPRGRREGASLSWVLSRDLTQEAPPLVYVTLITSSDMLYGLRAAVCKHLAQPGLI